MSADNIVYISELTKQKMTSLYPTEAKKYHLSHVPISVKLDMVRWIRIRYLLFIRVSYLGEEG